MTVTPGTPTRYLYAVAYEKYVKNRRTGRWKMAADIEYLHAENATHAKMVFRLSEPDYTKVRIVSAAISIGNFCNEHGEGKTADIAQRFVI